MSLFMLALQSNTKLTRKDKESCGQLLQQCEMFNRVPPPLIKLLTDNMEVRMAQKNEILTRQGENCDRFFLLKEGEIRRAFYDKDIGRYHNVEFVIKAKSINSMRVIGSEKVHNTVKCVSNTCKLYEMQRDKFLTLLKENPDIAVHIAEGLSEEVRMGSRKYQTPLLQQQQQDINVPAVAIAAGIESYYRSALNAMLNARLTGVKADLFPNMHIQVPVRISYITGFKGLRSTLDKNFDPDDYSQPEALRLGMAFAPGVLMTPISSILEASNAGHMNPEPMSKRWMRGACPRAGREVIFGLGLNQLSDYFEERLSPIFPNHHPMVVNAAGSMLAGVVSGYFSHVPHNMSTYKLLEPHRSYGDLYRMFVDKSVPPIIHKVSRTWPTTTRNIFRTVMSTIFPRGLVIRTTQIVGSFIILNGTINYLQLREHRKIQSAVFSANVTKEAALK